MAKLSKEALEAKRAYYRNWRINNLDKVQASIDRYWEKKAGNAASDPKGEQMTPEAKARALKQAGKTQREIAKVMGISLGTVNRLLKID